MDSNDYSQQQIQKEGKKKELFGFRRGLKKLYKKIHDKKEEETEEQCDKNQKFYLSKPILQNTKNEIKLTETGTLDLSKMDENMKKILQNAGITEQEMNDKEFAPFICDALSVFNENISSFIDQEKQQEIDRKQSQQVQESDQNQAQKPQYNDIKLESQNINGQEIKHQDSGDNSEQIEKDNQSNVINQEQQKLEENSQDNIQNQQIIEKINNQNNTQNHNLQNQNQETLNNQIKQSAINPNERNNLLHQIRAGNFNLRKAQPAVEKKKTLTQNIEIINQKNNQQNLTNYLAQAILQRRNQLKKHYTGTSSEQESSDSEFSD
ncbi:hypothetical protein PPERSA_10428 [Pseudocohnilembus persalinus]|uniref:WH2 domain-containing protein n=1 Tax=Pseudocohnilembus persalinus TaxID=266149 RepID=A0A0V0QWY6_PSEPJ|nr:hypothetical protein PPERSA_10428 [Pseudocohnilembus persalinus]|eukprot:KRX06570.1 hypothetical protein PPERSA_10428 [Pseudocohnilembus persalinus]